MNDRTIAKEISRIAKELSAASEIHYDELPEDRIELIEKMTIGHEVRQVWSGIHGYIIKLGDARLDKSQIKQLVADKNFRWIDGKLGLTIGL